MARFQINGVWYDAPNYTAARAMAQPAPVVAPPVVAPALVVPTVTPVLTPTANFVSRSKVRFGIGETITLGFTTTPLGQTAASFGGLTWAVRSGPAAVVNDPGNVGTGTLTCGTMAGPVTLELRTATLPVAVKATKRIDVVRPTDVVFAQRPGTNTFHRRGSPSAGFQAVTYLRPTDVSFSKLEFREGGGAYVGTGIFERREATLGELGTSYDVIHPIRADWADVDGGDSAVLGSMVGGYDTVSTEIGAAGVGTFRWSIPQLARVRGTRDDFIVKVLDHEVSTTATGALTISKGGVVVTHQLNDADSDY